MENDPESWKIGKLGHLRHPSLASARHAARPGEIVLKSWLGVPPLIIGLWLRRIRYSTSNGCSADTFKIPRFREFVPPPCTPLWKLHTPLPVSFDWSWAMG